MVVVAEGTDRERMKAALDAVADRVKAAAGPVRPRLPPGRPAAPPRPGAAATCRRTSSTAVRGRLDRMEPLLGPLGPARVADAARSSRCSATRRRGAGSPSRRPRAHRRRPRPARPAPGRRRTSAAATLRDPAGYRNPWAVAGAAHRRPRRRAAAHRAAVLLHPGRHARAAPVPAEEGGAVVHPGEGGERRDAGDPRRGRRRTSPA